MDYAIRRFLSRGGGDSIRQGRGCSSEILNLPPKRDKSGCGRSLSRPLKETVYVNRVNMAIQNSFVFVISSRATLNETLTAINNDIWPRTP